MTIRCRRACLLLVLILALGVRVAPPAIAAQAGFPVPQIAYEPRHYLCPRVEQGPLIDGRLDDAAWKTARWTESFIDIRGAEQPAPFFATRAKMLWDDRYFYVAADLEEPHLWATYAERDAIIYHENDFEVFIDPDGDTHEYYELEINALGTVWDLLLIRPYRDGGPAVHAWDIAGLRTAVHLDGTLNDPTDEDRGWTVEIAFPWEILRECAHRAVPPEAGDRWRINFSRVQWHLDASAAGYAKQVDPATGTPRPEENWVWSPQGLIAMHYPEMWGFVEFATERAGIAPVARGPADERLRWQLRLVYYAQKERHARGLGYSADPELLGQHLTWPGSHDWSGIEIHCTPSTFEARAADGAGWLHIDHRGRLWRSAQ